MTIFILSVVVAQSQFVTALGGLGDEGVQSLVRTADGGYALAGYTAGSGAGGLDLLLAKYDGAGNFQWARTLGGAAWDVAGSVVQTADGGYALAGYTASFGNGGYDVLLVKFDGSGNLQWARTVGGSGDDGAGSLVVTADGGYALAGWTNSFGAGGNDVLFLKLDSTGTLKKTRVLGGPSEDLAISLVTAADGGYALGGYTSSYGAGLEEFLLAKLDSSGTFQWARTVGGASTDYGYWIVRAADGGYAMAGYTDSYGAGTEDVFVMKFNSSGTLQWARTFGGAAVDRGAGLVNTPGGGYAVTGETFSFGSGGRDLIFLDLESTGALLSAWTVGGPNDDGGYSIVSTPDGGYALGGYTQSFGAGGADFLLAKFNSTDSSCVGGSASLSSASASPSVAGPVMTPTIAFGSLVTSPSPTVMLPPLTDNVLCYVSAVTERNPVGGTPALTARLVRGGLSISVTSPTGVAIYRADGRLVRTLTVRGTARVALTPGVYLLRDEHGETLTAAVGR